MGSERVKRGRGMRKMRRRRKIMTRKYRNIYLKKSRKIIRNTGKRRNGNRGR